MRTDIIKTEENLVKGGHKGFAILGAKDACAVISDIFDPEEVKSGIRHFYFRTYEHDYINGGYPVISVEGNIEFAHKTKNEASLNPVFAAYVKYRSKSNPDLVHQYRTFFTQDGNLVVSNVIVNQGDSDAEIIISPFLRLTEDVLSLQYDKKTDSVVATGVGKAYIIIAMREVEGGKRHIDFSSERETWEGKIQVLLERREKIPAGTSLSIEYYLIPAGRIETGLQELGKLRNTEDVLSSARTYWDSWFNNGLRPNFSSESVRFYYEANLLSLKAVNLGGAIPGDLAGQFVAGKSSMFAPRDSMMAARAFMLSGHIEETVQILDYWGKVPLNNNGFFYAWYADVGRIEEKGTGAPHDNPQYDSNAYYTYLVLRMFERTGEWYGNYELVIKLLDFLCEHQTEDGLLEPEGGVIEVMGKLPGTNMSCAAGLEDGAIICYLKGDYERSGKYYAAAQRMKNGLLSLFDETSLCYMDVRNPDWIERHNLTDGEFAWDTSMLLSVLLGFPSTPEIESSNEWYLKNCEKLGGGIQYAPEYRGHSYSEDLFLIFTGISAQYQALYGKSKDYQRQLNWMMKHSNLYGLMPERILMPDGKEACKASPLSWACAEFVSASLMGCFCAERLMGKTSLSDNLKFVKVQIEAITYYLREIYKGNASPELEIIEEQVKGILEEIETAKATGKENSYSEIKEKLVELDKAIEVLKLDKTIKSRLRKKTEKALFFLNKGIQFLELWKNSP